VPDIVCLDVATQLFGSQPIQWQLIQTRYSSLRPVASSGMNMFLSIRESCSTKRVLIKALQYAESFSTFSERNPPWDLHGTYLTDMSLIKGLVLQQAMWYCFSLRLAVLFDAPLKVRERIIADGQTVANSASMITTGTEWQFFKALHLIRINSKDPRIQEVRDHLCTMPLSKSFPLPFCGTGLTSRYRLRQIRRSS